MKANSSRRQYSSLVRIVGLSEATGQHVNKDKTKLLPIGALKTLHQKQQIDDFQVTTEANILGVTLHQGIEAPTCQWQSKMAQLEQLLD